MATINTKIIRVETSVARPADIQIFRGEMVPIELRLTNYGQRLDLTGYTAEAYYQSPDMGDSWYKDDTAGHLVIDESGEYVTWLWTPDIDAGADKYKWFVRVYKDGDDSYRAFGQIEMLGSPSLNPGVVPIPKVVLDFSKYDVVNAPYYTKEETDDAIEDAISEIPEPDYPVTSVNGKTGAVTLTASDVGALPNSYTAPVTSVNGKTGIVTLTASDVGAQTPLTFDNAPTANSSNPVTSDGINTAITVNDSFSEWTFTATPSTGISNISAFYSEMESCWIVSATLTIDGQSIPAAVPTDNYDPDTLSLTATFQGQETWVVSGTRELVARIIGNQISKPLQPAGDYALKSDIPTPPVTSVNSKTGAVVLTASDVGALPSTYVAPVASVNGKTGAVTLTASDVGAQTPLTFDNAPTASSTNPVTSDGIYTALSSKQDTLTFDNIPTANSNNPVKSSGIKTALDGKASTADATLTTYYSGGTPTYSEWVCDPPEAEVGWDAGQFNGWYITYDGTTTGTDSDPDALSLSANFGAVTVTATRTITNVVGYVLGSQTEMPLQPAGDYAASSSVELVKQFTAWTVTSHSSSVVPPYTMAWETDGNGYSYWVLHCGNDTSWAFNPAGMNHDATYLSTDDIATCERTFTGYVLGNQTDKELQAAGDYASASSVTAIADKIPAAATSQNQLADKAWVTSQISATVGNINSILDSINGEVL